MATSTITGSIIDAAGLACPGVVVFARLMPGPASRLSDGTGIANPASTITDASGVYSFTLEQQANVTPAGSWWEIEEDRTDVQGGRTTTAISVGANNSTVAQSRVAPLALLGPSALTQAMADARYERLPSFLSSVQYVATDGDDNANGLTPGSAKLTIAAAIAALPLGTALQRVGVVIVGAGTFSTSATLEIGYGGASTGGFQLLGAGRGVTNLVYTGAGTAVQFANRSTAEQKHYATLRDFTLTAATAAIGLDLKGSTYGTFVDIEVIGASSIAGIVAGSIGIKFDGSYGGSIGCWWNKLDHYRVSGFETGVKLTGTAGTGQANENKILNGRVNAYSRCGIDSDVGDNNVIDGNDVTTGTAATVPTVAGIRANGLAVKVTRNRFEQIGSGGICVLVDGVGAKPGDRCIVAANLFSTEAGSIAVKLASGSKETTVDPAQMFSRSPAVTAIVDSGAFAMTAGSTPPTWSTYGRGMFIVWFTATNIAASTTGLNLDLAGMTSGLTRFPPYRPFQIRGIIDRPSAVLTAGQYTLTPSIAGAAGSLTLTVTSTDGTSARTSQNMGIDTDVGANGIGVVFNSNGAMLPDGSIDLAVGVVCEYTS